jgi:hypothetical protein
LLRAALLPAISRGCRLGKGAPVELSAWAKIVRAPCPRGNGTSDDFATLRGKLLVAAVTTRLHNSPANTQFTGIHPMREQPAAAFQWQLPSVQ